MRVILYWIMNKIEKEESRTGPCTKQFRRIRKEGSEVKIENEKKEEKSDVLVQLQESDIKES